MSYLYRVRVIKYPEGSTDESGYPRWNWQPENWDPYEYSGPPPASDPNWSEPTFSWPHQRQYLSRSNAVRRAELFRKYGAEVVVERSNPITWPEAAS